MRGVSALRPSIGLARYHVLAGVRTAHGAFAVSLLVALFLVIVASATTLLNPLSALVPAPHADLLAMSAQLVSVAFILHLVMMTIASVLVSAPRGEFADLMETAPLTPAGRFLGDMFGALACTLVIHVCTLPLLAVLFVLSPVPTSMFLGYEAVLLLVVLFGSALSSWKRRVSGAAGRARAVGSVALFGTLLFFIVASTTHWPRFRDALTTFISEPAPLRLRQVGFEITNPPLLTMLVFMLYSSFLTYYAMRSIRLLQRSEEGLR